MGNLYLGGYQLEILLMEEIVWQGVAHRIRDYPLVVVFILSGQIIQKNLMELFGLILEILLLEGMD